MVGLDPDAGLIAALLALVPIAPHRQQLVALLAVELTAGTAESLPDGCNTPVAVAVMQIRSIQYRCAAAGGLWFG